MAKDGSIIINERGTDGKWSFQRGIGDSPLSGLGNVRNINVSSIPGVAFPNRRIIKDGTSTIPELPIAMIKFNSVEYAVLGSTDLWWRGASLQWAVKSTNFASGKVALWRDFVIGGRGTSITTYSSVPARDDISNALTTASKQMTAVLKDAVYIVGNNNVTKLTEAVGKDFDPTDSSTYVLETDKLVLPEEVTALSITTWNNLLVIGGDNGIIYTWDGDLDGYNDASQATESDVQRLITLNRKVYAQIGKFGNWYLFNGVTVDIVKEMPDSLFQPDSAGVSLESEGVAEVNNKIYFGMDASPNSAVAGIYSLDLATYDIQCEDELASGENDSDVAIGAMLAKGDKDYYVGWELTGSPDTYGIDIKTTSKYDDELAFIESQYYILTRGDDKKTYKLPVIMFAKQLTSGDSAVVSYRETLSDAWTEHATINTVGTKRKTMNSFPPLQSIQIKVALNVGAELTNIILK